MLLFMFICQNTSILPLYQNEYTGVNTVLYVYLDQYITLHFCIYVPGICDKILLQLIHVHLSKYKYNIALSFQHTNELK